MRRAVILTLLAVAVLGGTAAVVRAAGLETVTAFNPLAGEFPEGIARAPNGDLFVGMVTGEIKRVTPGGAVSSFARVPSVGTGFLTGLAVDAAGNLYGLVASFDENTGVWFFGPDGAVAVQIAALPPDGLPNAIKLDAAGNLFVSDTIQGAIWKIAADGVPVRWSQDPLLSSDVISALGFPVGINGMAFAPGGQSLYAVVTQHNRLVRIPVNADGSAGAAQVVLEGSVIGGPDGMTVGPDGTIYVAGGIVFSDPNTVSQIVAVQPNGSATVLASGEPLRFPASVVLDARGEVLYITNFDAGRMLGLQPGDPAPALLSLTLADAPLAPGQVVPAPPATGQAGLLPPPASGSPLLGALLAGALFAAGVLVVRRPSAR